MLNVTNAKVWANIVLARSLFANCKGSTRSESIICGRKAKDSARKPEPFGCIELRWSREL